MNKHILLLIPFLFVILSITTSCGNLNTAYDDVYVKIVDEYHEEPHRKIEYNGHMFYYRENDGEYIIFAKYEGEIYKIKDKASWEKYANCVGEYAKAKLCITYINSETQALYSIDHLY